MIRPGEIYLADFEEMKPHPILVLTRDELNRGNWVAAVLITSLQKAIRVTPFVSPLLRRGFLRRGAVLPEGPLIETVGYNEQDWVEYGLNRRKRSMTPLIGEKRNEIVGLCRRYRVRALELFGSAVNDRFDTATSDIDFLVDYEALPPKEHAACYFGLLFSLQDLLGREIDLVELSAVRNPYFLQAIAPDRVLLYAV